MRPATRHLLLAAAASALCLLFGLGWLLESAAGARFALTALGSLAGVRLRVEGVEGRLSDRLRLTGVAVAMPGLTARIDSLELDWEPERLLTGELVLGSLAISGVRVQDDRPPSAAAPQFGWPRLGPHFGRLGARIAHLELKGVSYRRLQTSPLLVTQLNCSASFDRGLLTLSGLRLSSPGGRLSGEIAAGLSHPYLKVDLVAVPTQPVKDMDLFSLQARLLPGRGGEVFAGGIALAGKSRGVPRLVVTGELGMADRVLSLRRLHLDRPGERGTLTGEGSMTLGRGEPQFSLALRGADLELASELKVRTRLSGTLTFLGGLSRYRGSISLANGGAGWQSAAVAADYRGGATGVKLAPISGRLLGGRLQGALDLGWTKGVRVSGNLAGRGLDPGLLAPGWQGEVNLDLTGGAELPLQGGLRGEFRGRLLDSRLHGRTLQGEVAGAFEGARLRVDRLFLAGRGFELRGEGELDRRLKLRARVSDLSRLIPGTAGRIAADGWLSRQGHVWSGALSGEGSRLVAAGVRAATLRVAASLGPGEGYPLRADASLGRLGAGPVEIESALLTLRGSVARHTLHATLDSAGSDARATLSGGLREGVWSGELSELSGRDGVGPWGLTAPAVLKMGAAGFRLAPLVIRGVGAERVELSAQLQRHPLSAAFHGAWDELNLARGSGIFAGVGISGGSSGNLDLSLAPGGRPTFAGRLDARGELVKDGKRLVLERLTAQLRGERGGVRGEADLRLAGGGGEAHLLFHGLAPTALALPEDGELTLRWSELDLLLLRPFSPKNLLMDGRLAGVLSARVRPGGRAELHGNTALARGHLNWRGKGEELDASLKTAECSLGLIARRRGGGGWEAEELQIRGQAEAAASYAAKGERIAAGRGTLRLDGDRNGLRAAFDLAVEGGGTLRGSLQGAAPRGLKLPETGELALEWGGLDSALLKPWLPGALNLEGAFSGEAKGRLLPGRRLEMNGEALFSQGRARWQGERGEMNANLRVASLSFVWRGESLSTALTLALSDYGQARGSLVLPIPARLPVVPDPKGALKGSFTGNVRERGFLTAFFPGILQESHADLVLDLGLRGIWSDPKLSGTLQLSKAGAYLPTAGITLSELKLGARLEGDLVRIEEFSALSGGGEIHGNMQLRLAGWRVVEYSGTLNGERFQTVYLPELQLYTSPGLSFKGGEDRVTVSGELRVPEMLISGPPGRHVVTASKDVVMEGAPAAEEGGRFPLAVSGRLHLVLGDKVAVKASGIDAQLTGEMDLVLEGMDNITSSGEIRVLKGRYRAYGMDLDIVRGRLYYLNEPVTKPTLDILALRTVGEVRAGVTVAGYLSEPVVKLYSEPPLPEVDILAYMVLGHPLGTSSEQGSMLTTAAGSLFSLGQSASLKEQIQGRLGLSVLGMETVTTSSAGLMGYKEVSVAPAGTPARQTAGQSLLTVGKYLTPKLYLSYGRSVMSGTSLFLLRYDILRHWQLETQSGNESGADIYYKVEFN